MNPECRWCGKPRTECPDWWAHTREHAGSEQTWRLLATAKAALAPDDELEVDRASTR